MCRRLLGLVCALVFYVMCTVEVLAEERPQSDVDLDRL